MWSDRNFPMLTTADYGELDPPQILTFTNAEIVDCVNIQIIDDNVVEGVVDEFFTVILGSHDFQVVVDTNADVASVFIEDNDGMFYMYHTHYYKYI